MLLRRSGNAGLESIFQAVNHDHYELPLAGDAKELIDGAQC